MAYKEKSALVCLHIIAFRHGYPHLHLLKWVPNSSKSIEEEKKIQIKWLYHKHSTTNTNVYFISYDFGLSSLKQMNGNNGKRNQEA